MFIVMFSAGVAVAAFALAYIKQKESYLLFGHIALMVVIISSIIYLLTAQPDAARCANAYAQRMPECALYLQGR